MRDLRDIGMISALPPYSRILQVANPIPLEKTPGTHSTRFSTFHLFFAVVPVDLAWSLWISPTAS